MADRGSFRGGARARGGGRGASTQQRGGSAAGGGASQQQERPRKENILDLSKYMDKVVGVKFNGGREGEFTRLSLRELDLTTEHISNLLFSLRYT